ncbi:hypothetical protein PS627_02729 [Pseudomonas fluorescens]|uniref:dermonecrotic toxin domain-containing protein n=1 Tax=Pseudomonas fluorescens TaxID=294 RepID=UPI001252630F|nr:DUF6543 domain-containing protein [Pseudomonas fluorescens]CAG8867968.1 hypothetical protein PS627_02729 [Pseudomonas fluorescens]
MNYFPPENLQWVRAALADFPRPDLKARETLQHWLGTHGVTLAADEIGVVTLHYQFEPLGEGRSHFREQGVIVQKVSLVEALLGNWQGEPTEGHGGFHYGDWAGQAPRGPLTLVERLEPPGLFQNGPNYLVYNGLYRRTVPARYDAGTHIALRAETLQSFIWGLHFHNLYKAELDLYWQQHATDYQNAVKINFIAACNKQVREGSLPDHARQLAWQVAGLLPPARGEASGAAANPYPSVEVRMLNVYGYTATALPCIKDNHSGLTLLYIPGNSSPLHSFDSESAMKSWFARQCQDPARRQALRDCFSPADWPDGLDFSGLETALTGLGLYPRPHRPAANQSGFAISGTWHPQEMVNYRPDHYSPRIDGDLFRVLTERQRKRSQADADSLITSNHQVDKARWRSYLGLATTLLLPVSLVIPELALLVLTGGIAQFGLGLDQAINGKTLRDKAQGVEGQVYGLLNALPLLAGTLRSGSALFIYRRPGWVPIGRLTRLLSETPREEPPIPLEPVESAFRPDEQVAQFPVSAPSYLVNRIDAGLYPRFSALIAETPEAGEVAVHYELGSDSFIRVIDLETADSPRFIIPEQGGNGLVRLQDPGRAVSDAQRMASLRKLGIQVDLPVDFALYQTLPRTPIPARLFSVWVGDREIGTPFLDALSHNSGALEGTDHEYQLFLSRQQPAVYRRNHALLAARAPRISVLPLEDQPAFTAFAQSRYFAQYQAALEGNGGLARNYSSAADILRVRLLHAQGGLYIDADDRLVLSAAPGPAGPLLARFSLMTTEDGLILAPPVSNDRLGMYLKYNTSMIGSHAGNPTLDAISEEMLQRHAEDPEFYRHRPDHRLQPTEFDAYARRLNRLTGPGVVNDVIDRRLPWLRQLRELCVLIVAPVRDASRVIRLKELIHTLKQQAPLDQLIEMGQANSWTTT